MKKMFQYIAMAVALVAMASCSQEETFEPDAPKVVKGMEFVVSDFPAYDDPQTRTIGTPEDGKTEWEEGDEILMIFDSPKYGVQSAALRYTESQWMLPEGVTFKYLEGETPEIRALYSPICEVSGGMFVTADEFGTTECLWGSCNLSADGTSINISFGGRTYSRLRIAAKAGSELHVEVTKFIPAGMSQPKTYYYHISANEYGNAYLYGTFAEGATVSVDGGYTPVDYTFSKEVHPNGTIAGKSYALDARPYLTFTADQSQTFKVSTKNSYTLDESIQYSLNGGVWTKLDVGTEITFGGDNGALRLRGKSSGGTASADNKYAFISFGDSKVKVTCSGDIRTLVDYDNYVTVSTANARFCSLFKECASLTTAPELPATTLAPFCYYGMFSKCAGLTTAPELPATTLADYCYRSMFSYCAGLTTAPKLPATTLAPSCYRGMFHYCAGLTTAPELPATTLADYCYSGMFYGCTGLTTAPELPVMTLAPYCYSQMFQECTGLTAAPKLPATTMAEGCYQWMFWLCHGLTTAPELPATTLAKECYNGMFRNCDGLTTAPELPVTTLAEGCYAEMFYQSDGLTTAPILPATTLVKRCYSYMFNDCKKLDNITMLATDISAPNCLNQWVSGVASTGTFTKAASLEQGTESGQIPTGIYGIPEGWTVKDYAE
ncbi:MAG: hypothetical protein IIX12_03670 [Alistipes sp.]|nr:hypothetical protein [Alistipes sp.]